MAYTTNVSSSNLVGRELGIASTFVKQYYTLLNKAPSYIQNFYSHDSTFIHGTIEMANEHYTEPIVGREKIRMKMEDLKLNDCRAKIKQIDCLETLAGGLVIQVIGELSNNGEPMRRFLQTFVLAPSPDEASRQDGDSKSSANPSGASTNNSGVGQARGGGGPGSNEANHNRKFFVLNSIFRYQDDGLDSEFEDDAASVNATVDGVGNADKVEPKQQPAHAHAYQNPSMNYTSNGSTAPMHNDLSHNNNTSNKRRPPENAGGNSEIIVDRLANDLDKRMKLEKPSQESEVKRDSVNVSDQSPKVTPNMMNSSSQSDRKSELPEKISENSKAPASAAATNANSSSRAAISSTSGSSATNATPSQSAPTLPPARPQPSNEPKTWATMVRTNYQPAAPSNVNKQVHAGPPPVTHGGAESQIQNSSQSSTVQSQQAQSQQQQQQQQSPQQQQQQPQQSPQQQQQQQQPSSQTSTNNNNINSNNNNNNNNNRRRHDRMRKPSNKPSGGRPLKPRPRPPNQAPTPTTTVPAPKPAT